jgi:hypothetical protein
MIIIIPTAIISFLVFCIIALAIGDVIGLIGAAFSRPRQYPIRKDDTDYFALYCSKEARND